MGLTEDTVQSELLVQLDQAFERFDRRTANELPGVKRVVPPAWVYAALPPFPGTGVVCEPARSPAQPTYGDDMSTNVNLTIRAYRCVCATRYPGKRCTVEKQARYKLRRAIQRLMDNKIYEPYAWAMFRLQQWTGKVDKVPSIYALFYSKTTDQQLQWFRGVRHRYTRVCTQLAPAHLRLFRLWKRARAELEYANPATRQEATAIVNAILSKDTYEALCTAARHEVCDMNMNWLRQMTDRQWVWGHVS